VRTLDVATLALVRPILLTLATLATLALLGAPPAHAAKKKRRPAAPPVTVVVLPFTGKAGGGAAAKEALELELELVENVRVNDSRLVERDLRKATKKKRWEKGTLAGILSRRKVDVLVRGERTARPGGDALLVIAYGKDGQPRAIKELALGAEPGVTATSFSAALTPLLSSWRTAPVVRLPDADGGRVRAEDVLVDERGADKKKALDFNDPDDVEGRKRSRLDDEDGRLARADVGDGAEGTRLSDVEGTVPAPGSTRLGRSFAISGAFDGGSWYYSFTSATGFGNNAVVAPFYPGGAVFVDAFPLAFAGIDWIGVDADLALSFVPFRIEGGSLPVTPGSFVSFQTRGGAALKLRYTLDMGLGVGARVGYRYFGANVETQTIELGGASEALTVVPGYELHAASLGLDVFFPFLLADRRFELELRADGLPATYYAESPDNPGGSSLAYGWAVSLAGRYDIVDGLFVEARASTTGAAITYTNGGKRQTFDTEGQLVDLEGGSVLNLAGGFNFGFGFMW
jgi:hypothetical protein